MKTIRQMIEWAREMHTCHEMGRWLQHYLDGELDATTAEQVRVHLLTCVRCGLEFDTYRRIVDVLHEAPADEPIVIGDADAVERLRAFAARLARSDDGSRGDESGS